MDLFFILKKIVGWLVSPLPIAILLISIGYARVLRSQLDRQWPKYIMGLGLIILIGSSLPLISHMMIHPIEFSVDKFDEASISKVDNIVVLGCYNSEDEAIPEIANIHECSLYRIIEAYRLSKIYPEASMILSGLAAEEDKKYSHPEYLANYLTKLGLNSNRLILLPGSKDTVEEAVALSEYMDGKSNLLVSSASHFKRIQKIFAKQKLDFVPVPTEYLTKYQMRWHWQLLLPQANSLSTSQRAWYEYLGNAWESLKQFFAKD